MAKNEKSKFEYKTLQTLTDAEVIKYADYMAEPLYNEQFFNLPSDKRGVDGYLTTTDIETIANARLRELQDSINANKDTQTNAKTNNIKVKTYSKKRPIALVIIMLLSLIILVASVIGLAGIDAINDYVTIINDVERGAFLIEPITALVDYFTEGNGDSLFIEYFNFESDNAKHLVCVYATIATSALIILCALISFIKAILALFATKKANGYKKYKFGYLAILSLVSAIVFAFTTLTNSGVDIGGIVDFVTLAEDTLVAGYVWFAVCGVAIINFICSCCAYKKAK